MVGLRELRIAQEVDQSIMSEDIQKIIAPSEEEYGSIKLRKPTGGTLALCDFAKLRIVSGGASEVPFFEAIAFFFIHSKPLDDVRGLLFDGEKGINANGVSNAFIQGVVEWGDDHELGNITEMGNKIGAMLTEAMTPSVEPVNKKKTDEATVTEVVTGEKGKKKDPQ